MKELKLIIACFFICYNCSSRDSLSIPNQRLGLSISAGISNNEVQLGYFSNNDFAKYLGHDFQLGIFYEKRLKNRLYLSTEVGLRYSEFTTTFGTCDNNPPDLNIDIACHDYQSDWRMLAIPTTVNLKFYYFKKRRFYVEIGGGLDFRLNKAPELEYEISSIHYSNGTKGEGFVQSGKDREDSFYLSILLGNLYERFNFGLGAEINQLDFGLYFKSGLARTICFRVRCPLLSSKI